MNTDFGRHGSSAIAFNSGEPVAHTLSSNASSVIIFEFYYKTHITLAVVNIFMIYW